MCARVTENFTLFSTVFFYIFSTIIIQNICNSVRMKEIKILKEIQVTVFGNRRTKKHQNSRSQASLRCHMSVFTCVLVRDICHRKPHNGPVTPRLAHSRRILYIYLRTLFPPSGPLMHYASVKPMHQSSRLQVSIRWTQKPSSTPRVHRSHAEISGN